MRAVHDWHGLTHLAIYGSLSVSDGQGPSSSDLYVGCDAGQPPCRDGVLTLEGLGGIHNAKSVSVRDCNALANLQGLEALREVESIWITDNELLTQVRALGSITHNRQCEIARNPKLRQCEIDWLDARIPSTVLASENGSAGTCPP